MQAPVQGFRSAGMRTLAVPSDPVARLWHSTTMLREHPGGGHTAALVGAGICGTEAHVLSALEQDIHPPESFGRIMSPAELDELITALEPLTATLVATGSQ